MSLVNAYFEGFIQNVVLSVFFPLLGNILLSRRTCFLRSFSNIFDSGFLCWLHLFSDKILFSLEILIQIIGNKIRLPNFLSETHLLRSK